jgi:DNA (cytosine-5)-methyltransferase 1
MVTHSKTIYDENFNHKLKKYQRGWQQRNTSILTGGFPCQPFSIAGLQAGFDDERSNVFWKILSIIDYHKPDCVILENVKNLVTHDETRTFKTMDNLEKRVFHTVGFKHRRNNGNSTERIYIVCVKSKRCLTSLDFPKIEKRKITEFLELCRKNTTTLISQPLGIFCGTAWWRKHGVPIQKNTLEKTRVPSVLHWQQTQEPGNNVPIILDDTGIRKLTPRECFNLQGFRHLINYQSCRIVFV